MRACMVSFFVFHHHAACITVGLDSLVQRRSTEELPMLDSSRCSNVTNLMSQNKMLKCDQPHVTVKRCLTADGQIFCLATLGIVFPCEGQGLSKSGRCILTRAKTKKKRGAGGK